MQVQEIMTQPAISIDPEESVEVAARTLTHYNIGALPVCGPDGRLQGLVTDRDLVTRCLASGKTAAKTLIKNVMTGGMTTVTPNTKVSDAANLMGAKQIRRLPVTENGKLVGILTLGDLAKRREIAPKAAGALTKISSNPANFTP